MGKIIQVEHSYDLGEQFSNVSFDSAWDKILSYLQENMKSLKKVTIHRESNKIKIQSTNEDEIINIILKIDPRGFFKKNLIRTIKLNVEFDKETKELKLTNKNLKSYESSNIIEYTISLDQSLKNDIYFHESSLLINYENINKDTITNSAFRMGVIFCDELTLDNGSNVIESKPRYFLCPIKNNKQIIFIEDINDDKKLTLAMENFISNFDSIVDNQNYSFTVDKSKYINFKLIQSNIILIDSTRDAILLFKNSMNDHVFNNYLDFLKNEIQEVD